MAKLYLSYEEFEKYAKELVAVSTKLRDGWKERRVKVASNPERETVFLVKSLSLLIDEHPGVEEREKDHHSSLEQLVGDESIEEEDDPAIMSSLTRHSCRATNQHQTTTSELDTSQNTQEVVSSAISTLSVHVEYHIVHSLSYEVPVLYFNATYSNGRQLSLDDTWQLLSKRFVSSEVDCWGLVSQQEHPLLHSPFYHVHPCHTAKVMGQTKKSKKEKVKQKDINGGCSLIPQDSLSAAGNGDVYTSTSSDEKEGCSRPDDQTISKSEPNYLITWLSTFGPLVGLKVPLEYGNY